MLDDPHRHLPSGGGHESTHLVDALTQLFHPKLQLNQHIGPDGKPGDFAFDTVKSLDNLLLNRLNSVCVFLLDIMEPDTFLAILFDKLIYPVLHLFLQSCQCLSGPLRINSRVRLVELNLVLQKA